MDEVAPVSTRRPRGRVALVALVAFVALVPCLSLHSSAVADEPTDADPPEDASVDPVDALLGDPIGHALVIQRPTLRFAPDPGPGVQAQPATSLLPDNRHLRVEVLATTDDAIRVEFDGHAARLAVWIDHAVLARLVVSEQRVAFGEHGAEIVPVDSEHSAVFQCLRGERLDRVRKVWLTASGGPFRDTALEDIAEATPETALCHPTWDMGPRITIGSATMMNKAFEVLEAHGMGLRHDTEMIRVAPDYIVDYACAIDRPDAEAVLISCGALRAIDVVDRIEQTLGKPVICSNQAMLWDCLRLAGIEDRLPGLGRLLREH